MRQPQSAAVTPSASTLADAVFDRLSREIIEGALQSGEILRDVQIAQRYDVSRTPVREALQRLSRIGLVETVVNRYTRVAEVTEQDILDTLQFTGHQAATAIRIAVPRLDDDDIMVAVEAIDALIAANSAGDNAELFLAARRFIKFMTLRTGNAVLQRVMSETALIAERNLRTARPALGTREERDLWYRMTRQAVVDRNASAAQEAFLRLHQL
ncbi:GntR family transcriptional regulator [Microbacterium sp. NPDC089695]|uniref:GntR family transcriptional regulator n=1 Tax=Microbacterium sp. NPDC089695 TaxID=3364198 RepID=UPI00380EC2D5